jgi:hypothetical protein
MTPPADAARVLDPPYLNARQAAIYCGFEPGPRGTVVRTDPQMKAFFSWASSRGVRSTPGRQGLYRRADLDAAIQGTRGAPAEAIAAAQRQARLDVADRRRRASSIRPARESAS